MRTIFAKKRWVSWSLAMVFGVGILSTLIFISPQGVFAQRLASAAANTIIAADQSRIGCSITALGTGTGCSIQDSIKGTAETVQKEIVVPIWKTAVVQGLLNISQFVVNRLAYKAAVMVATGCPGQDSLFYGKSISVGCKDFGLEI